MSGEYQLEKGEEGGGGGAEREGWWREGEKEGERENMYLKTTYVRFNV